MSYTLTQVRILRAPPERVYRAFLDPAALAKWNAPNGFTAVVHELDARVGGRYRISFVNFGHGQAHSFGGEYLELVPGERIVATDRFDDPNLPDSIRTTVTFKAVSCGCELTVTQAGLPDVIPADACRMGWQESLDLLARLVEPEIPTQ
ncbi:SRPBCC family protein [Chitiniphilus purpureus]|uniref:SRPBCC family protein n=1 Tax=Chitiniphilus purpureus TaxID=2981137 RepID=A0ABY6DK18_9NEIS|nr:SRPBCC family protein [Chitiniphilus sp. CD1]UXY14701.1 SRPBCC family protein [Chitiniphilus sp. CD1]